MDPKPNRNLSEISHLFLSSLRDRQTGGAPRPQRRPPQPQQEEMSIDMTPEEFARMHGAGAGAGGGEGLEAPMAMPEAPAPGAFEPAAMGAMSESESAQPVLSQRVPPVTAVIASHLNGQAMDRVRQYARHLAAGGQRVGLIEVDAGEFVVICFEAQQPGTVDAEDSAQPPIQRFDARQVSQAIEELNWDLDRWLLVLPNTRTPEARQLLELTGHWVLLSTADRDSVVACYRTIKGLAEEPHPALSLAILGAGSDAEAAKISQKLVSVCGEFLSCAVEVEPAVGNGDGVAEHMAICCDLAGGAEGGGQQWQLVSSLLSRASKDRPQVIATVKPAEPVMQSAPVAPTMNVREVAAAEPARPPMNAEEAVESVEELTRRLVEDVVMPPVHAMKTAAATVAQQAAQTVTNETARSKPAPAREPVTAVEFGPAAATQSSAPAPAPVPTPAPAPVPPMAMPAAAASHDDAGVSEVIDLTDFGGISGAGILSAVLRQGGSELAECPVRPPMCAEARLAVSRDRRLVLLAAARQGLGDLRAIGQAYHWMMENRTLIAMAMPQFAIDAHQPPQLRLLVDQADASAQLLQPMLESRNVTVQTYRRLRWGPKTGLLLEAA